MIASIRERTATIIRYHAVLWAALAIAVALKAIVLMLEAVPFNADEAVVALMAKHILQGERPLFFYGQAYLGSTDAWLVAGAFALVGEGVLAIRFVQGALYLGVIATTYALGWQIFRTRWAAGVAALWLALPPVFVTLYTTASLGGYGETLLLGNVVMLWALRLREQERPALEWLAFGLLAGFGFYTFGLLGVYLVPSAAFLVLSRSRRQAGIRIYLSALLGFVLGCSPWWLATLGGAATLSELGGSAIAGAAPPELLQTILLRLFGLLILGPTVLTGLRPSWSVEWLALPLAPFGLIAFIGAISWAAKRWRLHPGIQLCWVVWLTLCGAFLFTPFGNDPSGRYFLPLTPSLALFSAGLLSQIQRSHRLLATVFLSLILTFHLWGNFQSALRYPPGLTTQFDTVAQVDHRDMPTVIEFLSQQGETRGYTNYWVSFPLAFLSDEQLVFTATLPYHHDFRYTARDNRYAPYRDWVAASARAAYIITNHPALEARLRQEFANRGITFAETTIGDFHIFYGLSRKVTPEELGLYSQP